MSLSSRHFCYLFLICRLLAFHLQIIFLFLSVSLFYLNDIIHSFRISTIIPHTGIYLFLSSSLYIHTYFFFLFHFPIVHSSFVHSCKSFFCFLESPTTCFFPPTSSWFLSLALPRFCFIFFLGTFWGFPFSRYHDDVANLCLVRHPTNKSTPTLHLRWGLGYRKEKGKENETQINIQGDGQWCGQNNKNTFTEQITKILVKVGGQRWHRLKELPEQHILSSKWSCIDD